MPEEIDIFYKKSKPIYSYPQQLVFIDETSNDGRDAFRRYARSKRGSKAVVRLPFSRGKRVSILAALSHEGFMYNKILVPKYCKTREQRKTLKYLLVVVSAL